MRYEYSIRESLQGKLQDFIRDCGFNCVHLEGLIRELVGLLASYREEDLPLFPEVFVCESDKCLSALAPSGYRLPIKDLDLTPLAAPIILKDCAPLAACGWAIFVTKNGNKLAYGLFRSTKHSLATDAEESMKGLGKDAPVILIRNRGHLVVELLSTTEQRFTATLTTNHPQVSSLETSVSALARSFDASPDFIQYIRRIISALIQKSHGTLLAVASDTENITPLPGLGDGVWLSPPIDLASLHSYARTEQSADALADLQGAEALLEGMMNSDGIVILGENGTIMAYHVFLIPEEAEWPNVPITGGGRRRAFELMKSRLGPVFKAVLFRSQDGETICEDNYNVEQ